VSPRPAPIVVWVPPGSTPLTSFGVQVKPMSSLVPFRTPVIIALPEQIATVPLEIQEPKANVAVNFPQPSPEVETAIAQPIAPRKVAAVVQNPRPAVVLRSVLQQPQILWTRQGLPQVRAGIGGGWENAELLDDLSVPPEVEAHAVRAMAEYEMVVTGIQLITSKPDKGGAIWRIETDHGPRSLKQLHRMPARSLFSVGAQIYLKEQGARVPGIVMTRDHQPCVEIAQKLWIVTDWIEPLVPASKVDLEGATQLCFGLGEFHRHSVGYVPPIGAQMSTRLRRWPRVFKKVQTKIGWFRHLGEAYSEMAGSASLLAVVGKYEEQARQALERLELSPYGLLVERGNAFWGLAHQDYGWSNGQVGDGGVWVIDLDGVAFDLPIRDLRKLITSTMDDFGYWDVEWMRAMIAAYDDAHSIEPDLYQVLLADMALPNEFYKHVKEIVSDPTFIDTELNPLLDHLNKTDQTKWAALKELEGGFR